MRSTLEQVKEIRDLMEDDLNETMAQKEAAMAPNDIARIKRAFLDGYVCCLTSYLFWVKDLVRAAEAQEKIKQKKTARVN